MWQAPGLASSGKRRSSPPVDCGSCASSRGRGRCTRRAGWGRGGSPVSCSDGRMFARFAHTSAAAGSWIRECSHARAPGTRSRRSLVFRIRQSSRPTPHPSAGSCPCAAAVSLDFSHSRPARPLPRGPSCAFRRRRLPPARTSPAQPGRCRLSFSRVRQTPGGPQ